MKRWLASVLLTLALISPASAFQIRSVGSQDTTGNAALCASQPFGSVFAYGSYYCFNNTFGIGNLVNGADFHQSVTIGPNFPNGTVIQWQFPNAPNGCTGCGGFAYGYPEIFYGKGEFGAANPYKIDGPWQTTVATLNGSISGTTLTVNSVSSNTLATGQMIFTPYSVGFSAVTDGTLIVSQQTGTAGGAGNYTVSKSQTISTRAMQAVVGKTMTQTNNLTVSYDITLGGNLSSYDTLIDPYVTNDFIGTSVVMEMSFFPQSNFIPSLVGVTCTTFTFGEARVGIQPSGVQVLVMPTSGGCTANRSILSATIDLKEIYAYLTTRSAALVAAQSGSCGGNCFVGINGGEYMQGVQFGIEDQVPAGYNSGPYNGYMIVKSLSYVWN